MENITTTKENYISPSLLMARSWAEIDLDALTENVIIIRKLLPDTCGLMAVVKANAYGHGDIIVSRHLNSIGITDFAVATLEEGIHLRKAGICGNILILGYTPASFASQISYYQLTQTVTDPVHARELAQSGFYLDVHLKIDTGMHRLGITPDRLSEIRDLFQQPDLNVTGMFTHLCTADSTEPSDIRYADYQIQQFLELNEMLKSSDIHIPIHIQSSYGVINYPGLPCDFARPGILLYGCYSDTNKDSCLLPNMSPVLSWYTHIASIRKIPAGESVGYGRTHRADRPERIAVLPVGYADGYPRNLSNQGYVIIHGKAAPVIGRICMDQMTVDISDIPNASVNDKAVLIGSEGPLAVTAEELAVRSGSITNELLSRIGSRIHRIPVRKKKNPR